MARPDKPKDVPSGGTAVEEPVLPAYDEGRVESVHEGEGLSEDPDPRTGEGKPADDAKPDIIVPKGADRIDAFPSAEVADRIGPYNKTTS
jgi:hypothetical protein